MRGVALAVALLLLAAAPAAAETRVGVRVGEHPGHGRVVLDWPAAPQFSAETTDGVVRLRFPETAAFDLGAIRRPPRNVAGVAAVAGGVDIALRPGATARVFRLGARIVVDAFAGPTPEAPPATAPVRPAAPTASSGGTGPRPGDAVDTVASRPVAAPAARADVPAPRDRRPPDPTRDTATARVAGGEPTRPDRGGPAGEPGRGPAAATGLQAGLGQAAAAPAPALPPEPGPAAPPVQIATADAVPLRVRAIAGRPRAVPLPFAATTAAAMLRRGDALIAAFDQAQPLDLAALRRDPVFSGLEVLMLPQATLLRLPVAAPGTLSLRRESGFWLLEAASGDSAPMRVIQPEATPQAPGVIALPAQAPGRVIAITDPESGLPLLLGPVAEAGQALSVSRRMIGFDLLETELGVAVLARSDAVLLRTAPDRFVLAGTEGATLEPGTAMAEAAAMTRSFDLPALPVAQLAERLRGQRAGIAAAAPLARFPLRLGATETLLALGLPHEAQAMVALAGAEDPRAATDPRGLALGGIAALLAGRLGEAEGLDATPLGATDELGLWRALLAAARGDATNAAQGIAAALPLLLGYPDALRERLLPLAAESLAAGDAREPLRRLLARQPDDALPLARGLLAEAEGSTDAALAAYATAASGRDRRARARALRRSVELRLANGGLDAAGAAAALEATLFAWRDDAEEVAVRLRIAALRTPTDGRGALALLRETEALFPERGGAMFPAMQAAFLAALAQDGPIAAIALHDAYPELVPGDAAGTAAIATLAEQLVMLDLADRAVALLRGAAERAADPALRVALGQRLAALLLSGGDLAGADAALAATAGAPLTPAQRRERALLTARIQARGGDLPAAARTLRALGLDGAAPLAELLAERADWPAAATEHAAHLRARTDTAPGELPADVAELAVRQAALLALAGDEAALATLRGELTGRLPAGPLGQAFAALTAPQLRGLADLPRLQRELALFRALPTRLEALRAGAPVTR